MRDGRCAREWGGVGGVEAGGCMCGSLRVHHAFAGLVLFRPRPSAQAAHVTCRLRNRAGATSATSLLCPAPRARVSRAAHTHPRPATLVTQSCRMFSPPSVPPPSPLYLKQRKNQKPLASPSSHALLSNGEACELRNANDALRDALHESAAEHGVEPWDSMWQRSACGHLSMAARHVVAAVGLGPVRELASQGAHVLLTSVGGRSLDRGEPEGVIIPTGGWKERWDMLVLALIIYSGVMVPFRVCFDADAVGLMWIVEFSMTCAPPLSARPRASADVPARNCAPTAARASARRRVPPRHLLHVQHRDPRAKRLVGR